VAGGAQGYRGATDASKRVYLGSLHGDFAAQLLEKHFPNVTRSTPVKWNIKDEKFLGSVFVEMATVEQAQLLVDMAAGTKILGRKARYQLRTGA